MWFDKSSACSMTERKDVMEKPIKITTKIVLRKGFSCIGQSYKEMVREHFGYRDVC